MPKQYPDLRFKYIRGLIRHERDQRRQHYLKQAAEWTSKAIVSLSLTDAPIRSIKQAQKLEGIGGVTGRVIKENIDNNETIKEDPPCIGKYISSAAALLVSMLNAQEILHKERVLKNNVVVLIGTRPDVHSPKHDTQTDSNIQPHNTHAKCLENGASDALYSNDDGLDGILLLVDIHEQGGRDVDWVRQVGSVSYLNP
uniref:Uncharacterized protein LOC102804073 n=1 Tax=Saccoglossus kowalevskii TaxID=10224 RepID=A0ABM0LZG7_SACKO|nr:PREDICTED: uncharacterized protein LOC102804073 [Saccoglossus kowalevskii]